MIKEGFIICENSYKEGFLRGVNKIYDYTFLTLDELLKKITFDYSKESIIRISLEYNIRAEIVKEYLSFLKYYKLFFDNPKLNFLGELYDYLNNNNLIVVDENYRNYLKNRNITIIGYEPCKELDYVISILEDEGYTYECCYASEVPNKIRDVYKFDNIDDEARFVFNRMKQLLDNNVPIRNIKIANYSNEYDYVFHRYEDYYKIPIDFENDKNILSTGIIKYLFELLNISNDFYDVENKLKEKYNNSIYLKNIINIINSYHLYNYSPKDTIDLFKMEIKNIKFDKNIYEDGIRLIDLGSPDIKEGDYVFVIGFNQENIPNVFNDDKYLSDKLLETMGLDTSIDNTFIAEKVAIHNLNLDINYIISYKLNTPFSTYMPSSLINKLNYNVIEEALSQGINEKDDLIKFTSSLDDYYKYGTLEANIKENIYDIRYESFDNKFKGINDDNLKKYLPGIIKLSYSSMSKYSKCAFNYLLSSILYLDKFETGIDAYIGTYSHKILELSYEEDFDYDKAKEEAISIILEEKKNANYGNDTPLTNKEKFFIDNMDVILKDVIVFNKLHESKNNISDVWREHEFEIKYDNDKLIFKGFIDKILIENGEETYLTIIDYKTGSDVSSLENVGNGFNMQLPLYVLMVKRTEDFNNPIIKGFYLQKIGPKDYPDFKLKGFTNSNENIINHIDDMLGKSEYISGLSFNKDGSLSKNSKVITDDEMEELIDLVENVMLDIYKNIRMGKFDINPKTIIGIDYSCKYCKFKDVCFVKEDDKVNIKKENFLKKDGE